MMEPLEANDGRAPAARHVSRPAWRARTEQPEEPASASTAGRWLLCRIDGQLCALPLDTVVEVLRPLPVEPTVGTPPCVLGLSIIRGSVVPVIDVGRQPSASRADRRRTVLLRVGERRIALAVERVLGMRTLQRDLLQELPPLLRNADATAAAIGTLDAELMTVLDAARLVPDELFEQVDRQAAAS
jgi:purine-binding chemotaxis protein CheW